MVISKTIGKHWQVIGYDSHIFNTIININIQYNNQYQYQYSILMQTMMDNTCQINKPIHLLVLHSSR